VDRYVGALVAAGLHDHEFDVAAEQCSDTFSLQARQRAPTRRESQHQPSS
jgi:hypothetical protein